MNEEKYFLKINPLLVRELGADAAVLYGFLCYVARGTPKNRGGFFTVETAYISKNLGWGKAKVISVREKIVKSRLIFFKQGVNQNVKNKYKIL